MDISLEILVDLCLDLALQLEDITGAWERQKNPEIRFLERAPANELGNTRVIKIKHLSAPMVDPMLAKVFRALSSFFIKIKRRRFSTSQLIREMARSLLGSIGKANLLEYHQQPDGSTLVEMKTEVSSSESQKRKSAKRRKSKHYFHRRLSSENKVRKNKKRRHIR